MRASAVLLSLLIGACSQVTSEENSPATHDWDADSRRIHARMMDAMGGERGWERARYFEFDFVVVGDGEERSRWSHRWDRWEGDYRLAGVREGDSLIALFDASEPESGRVWRGGVEVQGEAADSLLRYAHARHINDSYWLLMPYKWTDPGVNVSYEGERTDPDGRRWEVIRLRFDEVGLTPQNEYLAFIDPESGLMARWQHFRTADAEPSTAEWRDWQRFGPISLSTEKPAPDGAFAIRFENVRVERSVPSGAFEG